MTSNSALKVRGSPAYGALLETIWSRLREEVLRAIAADRGADSEPAGG